RRLSANLERRAPAHDVIHGHGPFLVDGVDHLAPDVGATRVYSLQQARIENKRDLVPIEVRQVLPDLGGDLGRSRREGTGARQGVRCESCLSEGLQVAEYVERDLSMGGQLAARDGHHAPGADLDDLLTASLGGAPLGTREHSETGEGVSNSISGDHLRWERGGGLTQDRV